MGVPSLTSEAWMACQPQNVDSLEVAPAVDGRRQVKAVLRVQLRLPRVGHGILDIV